MSGLLPIHGFALAGGKSTRMGQDKALLPFRGRPMVEIAVEKLRTFCSAVSIAGNREDLARFAPIAPESRLDSGPAAGIEAGLQACTQPWALFLPVDVPLVPGELLQRWASEVLRQAQKGPLVADHLFEAVAQPAFCMVRQNRLPLVTAALNAGERRLSTLFGRLAGEDGYTWHTDMQELYGSDEPPANVVAQWFANVNTPEELRTTEALANL